MPHSTGLTSKSGGSPLARNGRIVRGIAYVALAAGAIIVLGSRAPAQPTDQQIFRAVLSPDDIQKIRQAELRPNDTMARIAISSETRKSFCDKTGYDFNQFRALTTVQQAVQIIQQGDDELRSQVHVNSDPQPIAEFRRMLGPIVTSCASNDCHGGTSAGNLVLIAPANDDAAVYTDFYLMTKYHKKMTDSQSGGIFSGVVERKLILRGHGDDSLLVNFGLPSDAARVGMQHPPVEDKPIAPMFRARQDPRCKQMVDWMDRSLRPIEPEYNISDYLPPSTQPAATQPAGR